MFQFELKNCLLATVLCSLLACTPKTAATSDGGISGGGGNTLPSHPSTPEQVRDVLKTAKLTTRLILNGMTLLDENERFAGYDKLFSGETTILDILDSIDIEMLMDKPCHDDGLNDEDGSVLASRSNAICISAFRIAPRVDVFRVSQEVVALIIHELSHVVGANEVEAIAAQKVALESLLKGGTNGQEFSIQLWVQSMSFSQSVDTLLLGLLSDSLNETLKLLNLANPFLGRSPVVDGDRNSPRPGPLTIYNKLDFQYNELERARWEFASETATSSSETMTLAEYCKTHRLACRMKNSYFADQLVVKPKDFAELRPVVQDLVNYYNLQSRYLRGVSMNTGFPSLSVFYKPKRQNPWEQFIGTYEIVDKECDEKDFSNESSVRIFKEGDLIYLSYKNWKVSLFEDGEDSGGPYFAHVGPTSTGAKVENFSGDLWEGYWDRHQYMFSKINDSYEFKIIKTFKNRPAGANHRGPHGASTADEDSVLEGTFHSSECTYTLQKG